MRLTLSKLTRRFSADERGSPAVEFAFLMPIIMIALFGIINLGLFFYSTHQAQFATEKTARQVRMLGDPSKEEIVEILEGLMGQPIGGVYAPNVSKVEVDGETYADIRVDYSYTLDIPFINHHPLKTQAGTRILLRTTF